MRLMMLIALAVALLGATCGGDDAADAPPTPAASAGIAPETIPISHEGGVFHVEVAVTPRERSVGLSGRTSLPADGGMLFVLDRVRVPSYWMKDTLIPLDFLWLAEDGTVAEITADAQPEPGVDEAALRRYSPAVAVRYVLELNGGAAARAGIEAGDQLVFDLP